MIDDVMHDYVLYGMSHFLFLLSAELILEKLMFKNFGNLNYRCDDFEKPAKIKQPPNISPTIASETKYFSNF